MADVPGNEVMDLRGLARSRNRLSSGSLAAATRTAGETTETRARILAIASAALPESSLVNNAETKTLVSMTTRVIVRGAGRAHAALRQFSRRFLPS